MWSVHPGTTVAVDTLVVVVTAAVVAVAVVFDVNERAVDDDALALMVALRVDDDGAMTGLDVDEAAIAVLPDEADAAVSLAEEPRSCCGSETLEPPHPTTRLASIIAASNVFMFDLFLTLSRGLIRGSWARVQDQVLDDVRLRARRVGLRELVQADVGLDAQGELDGLPFALGVADAGPVAMGGQGDSAARRRAHAAATRSASSRLGRPAEISWP